MKNIAVHYGDNIEYLTMLMRLTYRTVSECNRLWFHWIELLNPPKLHAKNEFGEEIFEEVQTKGLQFIRRLYALSEKGKVDRFDIYEVGKELGFDEIETEYIVESLVRSEMIKYDKESRSASITSYGIMSINGEIPVGYAPIH